MIQFTNYPSGNVLCCFRRDNGAVIATCNDPELTLQQRADRARKEVERIIAATLPEHPKGAMIDERV